MPTPPIRNILQRLKFPSRHRAGANISHLSTFDNIIERFHDLLTGSGAVQAVDLQHVDICAEAGDRGVDGIKDMLPAEPNTVYHLAIVDGHASNVGGTIIRCDTKITFGEDD